MSDSDAVSGLAGTVRNLWIEQHRNGYRIRCGNFDLEFKTGYEMFDRQEYVAESKELLAKLVIRLMADPPEPGPA